jgi:hypothetical protein
LALADDGAVETEAPELRGVGPGVAGAFAGAAPGALEDADGALGRGAGRAGAGGGGGSRTGACGCGRGAGRAEGM